MNKFSRKKPRTTILLSLLSTIFLLRPLVFPQEQDIRPVIVEESMPDFTLPVYQGGDMSFSSLKGKKVMIIFPRGYAAEGRWCTICNYKYADLLDLEKTIQLRKKFNLEILIVLPYGRETIKAWLDVLLDQLEKIKGWKYPSEPDKLDEKGKNWAEHRG